MHPDWIVPDWPAPANARALSTTRAGGIGAAPWDSFNLAGHVGDDPAAVAENRRILRAALPAEPVWLNQVHGAGVIELDATPPSAPPEADAAIARAPGRVCVYAPDAAAEQALQQAGEAVEGLRLPPLRGLPAERAADLEMALNG